MELICTDPYYGNNFEGVKDYGLELSEMIKEIDGDGHFVETDIGHGADFPGYLIEVFQEVDWKVFLTVSVGGIFLMGEKINKNIDAWLEIGKKVRKLIDTLKPSHIDENGAVLLFLDELSKTHDLSNVKVSVQIIEGSPVPWGKGRLDKRPDSIYLITATFPDKVYVYGVTASRKEAFRHEYGLHWTDFYNI